MSGSRPKRDQCLTARRSYHVRELDWLVRTIQIHTTAMVGAARRAHVRRTVHWRGQRGRRGGGGGVTSYKSAASVEDRSRRGYRLHSGGPVEDWRRRAAAPVEDWGKLPGRATRLLRLE
jgi:hypothetical protein